MAHPLESAVIAAKQLPAEEHETLAAILIEEMESEQRWTRSLAASQPLLGALAAEALAEFKAGKTRPLDELL